jgi:siroheme synthase
VGIPAATASGFGGRCCCFPERWAACIQQGTTANQRVVVSTLERLAADVAEAGLKAPVATVVGDVVNLRETLQWFTPS